MKYSKEGNLFKPLLLAEKEKHKGSIYSWFTSVFSEDSDKQKHSESSLTKEPPPIEEDKPEDLGTTDDTKPSASKKNKNGFWKDLWSSLRTILKLRVSPIKDLYENRDNLRKEEQELKNSKKQFNNRLDEYVLGNIKLKPDEVKSLKDRIADKDQELDKISNKINYVINSIFEKTKAKQNNNNALKEKKIGLKRKNFVFYLSATTSILSLVFITLGSLYNPDVIGTGFQLLLIGMVGLGANALSPLIQNYIPPLPNKTVPNKTEPNKTEER